MPSLADRLKVAIRDVPDFPKPGIAFKDITPVLQDSALFGDVTAAIARETRLKKYKREWKINLIEQDNPHWRDLAADFTS